MNQINIKQFYASFLGLGLALSGLYIKTTPWDVSSSTFMVASGIATIIINIIYVLYKKIRG